jgi:hypothetical protein
MSATKGLMAEYAKLSKTNSVLEIKVQRHLDRLARQNRTLID